MPLTPFPVFESVTVIETMNAFPACALLTVALVAVSIGLVGGGGGGGAGGGGGELAVICRVADAVAPESSVTVSVAV
jgi:hypothetical protein